jgi:hypothetical protein
VSTPVTPRKNARAFGGSGVATAHEWFESKIPNCVDFDKDGEYFTHPLTAWLVHSCGVVPIYDASNTPFLFQREDFVNMPNFPLYRRREKISDLPVDSLVSVFFTMSSYAKKTGSSSTGTSKATSASGSPTFKDVLSLNIQSVIYYGTVPSDLGDD